MPTAIVTGATGILGREIIFELARDSKKWTLIHALSRSKKETYPSNVVHDHVDLLLSAEEIAQQLKDVKAEYIFFTAYLAKPTEQEAWDTNGAMLRNFLSAIVQTGAIKDVKRIILVTGAKQFGVHLGTPKNPMLEDDKWLDGPDWPPNFYYNQQNILHKFCKEHSKEWVVTYPNDVIGVAEGNFMNLSLPLALYAIVSKELGQDLVFPGNADFYVKFDTFTNSKLHAEFCAWAAFEPKAKNEAFNVVNGDVESWQNMWPRLAQYFGLKVKPDQFANSEDLISSVGTSAPMAEKPPVTAYAASAGLVSHPVTGPSQTKLQIDLVKWSQRTDVKEAWKKIAKREDLREEVFEKATWDFLGFVLGRPFDLVISMSKARKAGWTGYRDTWESLEGAFGELREKGIIPKA